MSGQQFYSNQEKVKKQTLKGQCRATQGPPDEGNRGTGRYNKVPNFAEQRGDISDGYELTPEQKRLDHLRCMRQEGAAHIRGEEAHIRGEEAHIREEEAYVKREKEHMKALDDEYEIAESYYVNHQNKKH